MKFRTEIKITPFAARIGYDDHLLCVGSCFAEHIAGRLTHAKFHVAANPTGIVFNPLSLAETIGNYGMAVLRDELHFDGEVWFHYGFHGDFSASDPDRALSRMNTARQRGAQALRTASCVLLTLGTAWVYERDNKVVANCHRQPAAEFTRRRLTVAETVSAISTLATGLLAEKQIILTVSPVRHIGDTLEGNAVSKSVLRLAAEELAEQHVNVFYFPAYELLVDDLRDYRFYADDLIHPSPQAIEYVWEKFMEAALCEQARELLPAVESIVAAATHRPRNKHSEAHKAFCRTQLSRIAALPSIDLSREELLFRRFLEINS